MFRRRFKLQCIRFVFGPNPLVFGDEKPCAKSHASDGKVRKLRQCLRRLSSETVND